MRTKKIHKTKIGPYSISEKDPVFIIAEIGINHNGSIDTAKRLIDGAAKTGADCAKFQMRHLPSLYANGGNPGDERENVSSQYTLDLLTRFELSPQAMFEAFDYCKARGIMPLCTPWDPESLRQLETYSLDAYKVASADLTNHELLQALAKTKKPLIISTGMSIEEEIKESVALLKKLKAKYILLHCNSTYPAPFKDINLSYLQRLKEIGDCTVGYSGHERGYHVALAAVALGAKVIEKHVTLDRSMEGSDHKVSLTPDEFGQMVTAIRQVEEAVGSDSARQITQAERMNRASLAKSLVAAADIKAGELITDKKVIVKSPGRGLQPNYLSKLIGRPAKRLMKPGDFFFPSDLEAGRVRERRYRFCRPWGIPVRYHDFKKLLVGTNPDFLEFHLSYKDMDQKVEEFFDDKYDLGLTVHSPDLFAGDHLLDLASEDKAHRRRSIKELQRVVSITRELKKYFKNEDKTIILTSLGGFSERGFLDPKKREMMYARIAESLSQINQEGVEIIAQTLPPFPWYFGGQYFLNLFVDPKSTADFCARYGIRLCFDVSHSKMACNHYGWSFRRFIDQIGPYIAYLQIGDAEGVDGEGLQIGEGEIDFAAIAKQLKKVAPRVAFIPEIWQGHENGGEGFWIALERLKKWF